MNYRINILCLIGAIIGIVAIFSGWIGISYVKFNLIDVLNIVNDQYYWGGDYSSEAAQIYMIGGLLCISGALIGFFSPIGGVPLLIGTPMFILIYSSRQEGNIPSGIGSYLAIASGIILLISLAIPIGIGYEKTIGIKERLLTFSPIKKMKESEEDMLPPPPDD